MAKLFFKLYFHVVHYDCMVLRFLSIFGFFNFLHFLTSYNFVTILCRFFLSKIKIVNICHHKNIIIISLLYSEFISEFYSELSSEFYSDLSSEFYSDLSSDLFSVLLLFIFYAISVSIILYLYKKVSLVCGTFGHLLLNILGL